MPVLKGSSVAEGGGAPSRKRSSAAVAGGKVGGISGWLPMCANPGCASGWLRLWRARQTPVFEGGWLCGPQCTAARVRAAVLRELKGRDEPAGPHRHRVPLGLLLLAQGAITREQLRAALARQKLSGGRIGMWLAREQGVEERTVTRALGAQWGCPVLSLDGHSAEHAAALAPRLLVDAFGFLPLRQAGGALLYVGFEDRIDRCVSLAIERMNRLRVESGIVPGRDFEAAHRRLLGATFPRSRLVEAASVDAMVAVLSRLVEAAQPIESRMVRMHEYFWLRLWHRRQAGLGERVEDVLCSLADSRA